MEEEKRGYSTNGSICPLTGWDDVTCRPPGSVPRRTPPLAGRGNVPQPQPRERVREAAAATTPATEAAGAGPRRRPAGGRGWLAARPVAKRMAAPVYPAWVTRWVSGQWRQKKRPPAIRPTRPLVLANKVANRRDQAGGEFPAPGR